MGERGFGRTARIPIGVAIALAALTTWPAVADTGFLDRSIALDGEVYHYQVYVPAAWTKEITWPVAVFLHGEGQQGTDGSRHTVTGAADAIRRDRLLFPMIVVMPQARPGARWSSARMQDLVLATLDRAMEEFHGDPDRVYLAGFAMGGQGATRIAARFPGRFAALVSIAGRISAQPPLDMKDQTDEDVRMHSFLQPDPYAGTAEQLRTIPIRVFHGGADAVVSVEESRRFVAALKNLSAPVVYTELIGEGHEAGAQKALLDRDLWRWLLLQQRNKPMQSREQPPEDASRFLQFDSKGFEFGPWIRQFVGAVKRNWFIPNEATRHKGRVVVTFRVHQDGTITDVEVAERSIPAFNDSARQAVIASSPVSPLPSGYPEPYASFTLTLYYNDTPR